MADAAVQNCRIFRLPRELRDEIYKLVVVEEEKITVTSNGYESPALLQTCKTIRAEAMPLFWDENCFKVDAPFWDPSNLIKLCDLFEDSEFGRRLSYLPDVSKRQPNYRNLLNWFREYHEWDDFPKCVNTPERALEAGRDHKCEMLLGCMFIMVAAMRDTPWTKVKEALLAQRPALVAFDLRWAEN